MSETEHRLTASLDGNPCRYLLDTNIIAEPTKLPPNTNVLEALAQHSGQISISSVSWHELWFGTDRLLPNDRASLALDLLPLTPMDRLPRSRL